MQHINLAGHLGAAHDSAEWPLGRLHHSFQVVQLLPTQPLQVRCSQCAGLMPAEHAAGGASSGLMIATLDAAAYSSISMPLAEKLISAF